jgi:hypothetical protein
VFDIVAVQGLAGEPGLPRLEAWFDCFASIEPSPTPTTSNYQTGIMFDSVKPKWNK